jgi:hypothetical protein
VDEVMRGAGTRQQLEQKLVSENFIYLQDSSPAYRVRAFQWLAVKNLAPRGFDPLDDPKKRREALDAALSSGGGK